MSAWPSRLTLTLLIVVLLWAGLSAQRPEHRDRLAAGLIPVVTTLPAGSPHIKPADIEIVDDGRVVTPTTIVSGERLALAVFVDVALGERERVWTLLGDVESVISGMPIESTPVRHVNQYKLRVSGRTSPSDFEAAPPDRVTRSSAPGKFDLQSKNLWPAADWALASLQFRRGRRVMIVVTDGTRRSAAHPPNHDVGYEKQPSFADFRARVRSQFATVIVVAIDNARLPSEWRELAEESGGEVLTVGAKADLREALLELAGRVSRQSVVYFSPATPDGRTHQLQLRLKEGGTALPSPAIYFAPKGGR